MNQTPKVRPKGNTSHPKPSTSTLSITIHRKKLRRIKFIPILTRRIQPRRISISIQARFTLSCLVYSADTSLNCPGLRSLEGAGITSRGGFAAVCKPFARNICVCVLAA